ncbi:MAG: PRC-barrel domain-containing protein [Sphingobium sp.]
MADPSETTSLLAIARPDTIDVRSRDGDKLGHVHYFLVDKFSGQTSYAVLSIGGFLGLGKSFYPVPFSLLAYDAPNDYYIVTADRRLLEGGPSWANNAPEFNPAYADRVSSYYSEVI